MATSDNPKNQEPHGLGNLAQIDEKHVNCIEQWLANAKLDANNWHSQPDKSYYNGQIAAFELVLELIHGKILDSDQEQ